MITGNYCMVAGISILCLVVNLLHLSELDVIKRKTSKQFQALACIIILEIVIDTLFKALEGNPNVDSSILKVLKTTEFLMTPILPFLILKLFNDKSNDKVMSYVQIFQMVLICLNVVLQAISFFGEFIFRIDENNLYVRTDYTFSIYATILVSNFVSMICSIYYFSVKIQNTNFLTLCGLSLMLVAGFVSRICFANTNFDWLCVSISFFIVVIYYVNLALRLDPLTQLLNRQVYQTLIERINFSTLIIMIDANDFKIVNDKYGHECGDRTLKYLAKSIFKAYGEYGWCFRIGGDEFCVILRPKEFKLLVEKTPKNDVYSMAEEIMAKLDEIIKEASSSNDSNFINYGVSQGYAIYYYPLEYPSIADNMPLDTVLRLADKRMYLKKSEYKKSKQATDIPGEADEDRKRARVVYEPSVPECIENSGK